jgi:Zn-dependent protease with chaperone function
LIIAGVVALVWVGAFLALLVLASFLSRAAMRASDNLSLKDTDDVFSTPLHLSKLYKYTLLMTCIFYYLSIPAIVTLALLSTFIFGSVFIFSGFVLAPLAFVILINGASTIGAVVRSLVGRKESGNPAHELDIDKHPEFKRILAGVARKVGTDSVSRVFLDPEANLSVFEKGGILRLLRGDGERCLILGIAVLEGMTVAQLQAILAHEYGHLSRGDTSAGGFALGVRTSAQRMLANMVRYNAASWWNPLWCFLQAFYRVFLRVSLGAARFQEALADRTAVRLFGAKAFTEGLCHIIENEMRFRAHMDVALNEAINDVTPVKNIYQIKTKRQVPEALITKAINTELRSAPSPYDSHPPVQKRFAWAKKWDRHGDVTPDDRPAWGIFRNRSDIEELMTDQIRKAVNMQIGILVPKEPLPPHRRP